MIVHIGNTLESRGKMANKIRTFPKRQMGRPETYPWSDWLDGGIWQLVKGDDFDCEAKSFRHSAYSAATRAGVSLRVAVAGDTVTIQKTGKA